eukprot:3982074-Alexandrium_andersonii.AAC.1
MVKTPHYPAPGVDHAVPEVSTGYCVLSKEGSETVVAVLVIKGRGSRAVLTRPVLCAGRMFGGTVDQAAENIRRLGHRGR